MCPICREASCWKGFHALENVGYVCFEKTFAADLTLERNIVMLGEHYTQVLNSIGGEFRYHDRQEHTDMLFGRVGMIEQLYEWAYCLGEYRRASRGLIYGL